MRTALTLLSALLVLAVPSVAGAASLAYIENGEVWLSSLDGAKKVRLAAPVVNANGVPEKWLAVAAADGGRIVAARNEPGKIAALSWFKAWEPNGTSTVEGPLNYPGGWAITIYPLGFDVTPDGSHMVYGYSNSGFCCPQSYARGTYVRPVTNSPLSPINLSGWEHPTLFGNRVIAHSGATVDVQDPGTPYDNHFTPWLDVSGTGLELRRTDIAATGKLAALEGEQWQTGTQTVGKIGLIALEGVGEPLASPPAVDCYLPADGVAKDASLSQDGRWVAWTDAQGLRVAGTPVTADDPCTLTSPPVVIAAGGTSASIGGADVAAFLPPVVTPPAPAPSVGAITKPVTATNAPSLSLPAKVTAKALASVGFKVKVATAGKITISATVGGKPVGTGTATAKGAGTVTIKLKLTKAGRKLARKGKTLKLKVTQAGRSVTKSVKLR